ncbi:MAG: hypothetical protein SOZ71_10860 [Clostridium sp.]|nr:hypothetical protein [Clostridium sp.]
MKRMKINKKDIERVFRNITLMILVYVLCNMLFQMKNEYNSICNIFFITIYTLLIMFLQEKEMHSFWKKNYHELYNMTSKMYEDLLKEIDEHTKEREDNKDEQNKISINNSDRSNSN